LDTLMIAGGEGVAAAATDALLIDARRRYRGLGGGIERGDRKTFHGHCLSLMLSELEFPARHNFHAAKVAVERVR
jgi:hypothetical protein